jgi:hypothetical protein
MSGDLSELYQQVILDHNKRPRNRGKLPTANRVAHGDNPTCGDQCSVFLRLDGDRIADISFDGSGCPAAMPGRKPRGRVEAKERILLSLQPSAPSLQPLPVPSPCPCRYRDPGRGL